MRLIINFEGIYMTFCLSYNEMLGCGKTNVYPLLNQISAVCTDKHNSKNGDGVSSKLGLAG